MVFGYAILGKVLMPPIEKRSTVQGKLMEIFGTWNGAAVTTGDLFTNETFDEIEQVAVSNGSAAVQVMVQENTPSSGQCRLTFTSGHAGTFRALILERHK